MPVLLCFSHKVLINAHCHHFHNRVNSLNVSEHCRTQPDGPFNFWESMFFYTSFDLFAKRGLQNFLNTLAVMNWNTTFGRASFKAYGRSAGSKTGVISGTGSPERHTLQLPFSVFIER